MRTLITLGLAAITMTTGCGRHHDAVAPAQREWFVDRASQAGLGFVHVNGMSGRLYVPEVLAPGVALFDFDNDGDLDVYLVQGSALQPSNSGPEGPQFSDRLFRNDLTIAADG
ncbi:MAG TPA: hypothetical protein VFS23_12595, partial [Vicinamibacterales bacterium]|nr:hypothetical protein [Vicinamibacterales bacterium]